jgi:hypothetical protein
MNEQMTEKERLLWQQAKKRVDFRRHLATYIIVNGFLWALWFFTGRKHAGGNFPWPIWPTLGWGIGLAFNFYSAYFNNISAVEREYEKLKNKQ